MGRKVWKIAVILAFCHLAFWWVPQQTEVPQDQDDSSMQEKSEEESPLSLVGTDEEEASEDGDLVFKKRGAQSDSTQTALKTARLTQSLGKARTYKNPAPSIPKVYKKASCRD